jgi:hypothetical protein
MSRMDVGRSAKSYERFVREGARVEMRRADPDRGPGELTLPAADRGADRHSDTHVRQCLTRCHMLGCRIDDTTPRVHEQESL